ncbi:hypothetical protein [Photobacterium leiognathi]|uniref:hypothetical protein n=1 Tax=Photobacterium leiognathi TaxID=553611 RepID=UPI00273A2EA1|nr:hypothetical protein [Photobacterium leiognathi]
MFIFREKGKLTRDDFAQIFCDVNGQQQPLTMNQLIKLWDDPATELAKKNR